MDRRLLIKELEKSFALYVGTKYAIGTSMGRTALLVLLRSININDGDEVIVPAYICEVVPNAILKLGGIPIFVDINDNNYHMSTSRFKSLLSPKTKAIIINHAFGYPEDIDGLIDVIKKMEKKIYLIEDAAHSMGATYRGFKVGSLGDAAIFSFTKSMMNIGGGAITTNDPIIAANARFIIKNSKSLSFINKSFFGMLSAFEMYRVNSIIVNKAMLILEILPKTLNFFVGSYNRSQKIPENQAMSALQAYLALRQVKKINNLNENRINIRSKLDKILGISNLIIPLDYHVNDTENVCIWYVFRLRNKDLRDELVKLCRKDRIYLSKFWEPIHLEKINIIKQKNADVPNAIIAAQSTLVFKIDPKTSEEKIEKIGKLILSNLSNMTHNLKEMHCINNK